MSHMPDRSVLLHRSDLGLGILCRICSGILYGSCPGILNGLWLGILYRLCLGIQYRLRGRDLSPRSFAGRPSLELT
jgi:hypothetical protein